MYPFLKIKKMNFFLTFRFYCKWTLSSKQMNSLVSICLKLWMNCKNYSGARTEINIFDRQRNFSICFFKKIELQKPNSHQKKASKQFWGATHPETAKVAFSCKCNMFAHCFTYFFAFLTVLVISNTLYYFS